MNPSEIFVKVPDFVVRSIAGETILVPVRSGVAGLDSIFTLDEVGAVIWDLIDGHQDAAQISQRISELYGEKAEQIEEDVGEFLGSLREAGLIQPMARSK